MHQHFYTSIAAELILWKTTRFFGFTPLIALLAALMRS